MTKNKKNLIKIKKVTNFLMILLLFSMPIFISENSLLQIALQKENKKESLTGTYFSIETEVRNLNLPTRVKKINRKIKLRIKKDYTISMYI